MTALVSLLALFSVLIPQKAWFALDQPVVISVKSDVPLNLTLTDFAGKRINSAAVVQTDPSHVDVSRQFPTLANAGTYILYATRGNAESVDNGPPRTFEGTPLVIEVRSNKEAGAPQGAMVTHVLPLCYADIATEAGSMQAMFYYDVAPNTVESYLTLAGGGYFDGLVFHRIVPGFVIQGGDPSASDPEKAGTGSPGFRVEAEFNDRPHERGVLSMARSADPNSAGSQFFVCLDYRRTQQLDHQYTAFGRVMSGLDAMDKIGSAKLADPSKGRPETPQVIKKITVLGVTSDHNPYAAPAAK